MKISIETVGVVRVLRIQHDGTPDYVMDLDQHGCDIKTSASLVKNFNFMTQHVLTAFPFDIQGAIAHRLIACLRAFDETTELDTLRQNLQQNVAHMFATVDFNRLRAVAFTCDRIYIPDTVPDEFHSGTSVGTPQQTYTKTEYRELLVLSLASRLMIPIWIKFIHQYRAAIGRGFVEKQAYLLINRSIILGLPATAKLLAYIRHYINANSDENALLRCQVSGTGTSNVEDMTLAKILVTMVPYIDVEHFCMHNHDAATPLNTGGTPLTRMFYMVRQAVDVGPRNTTAEVRPKHAQTSGGENPDGGSRAEEYRVTTSCTPGEAALMDFYTSSENFVSHFFRGLEKTLDVDKLKEMQKALLTQLKTPNEKGQLTVIYPVQIAIAGWLCGYTNWRDNALLPLKALDHVSVDGIYNAISCAQAYLIGRNWFTLAALLSAEPIMGSNMAVEQPRDHIRDAALIDKLREVFPAAEYVRTKRRRASLTPQEPENRIIVSINQLVLPSDTQLGLGSYNWRFRLPEIGDIKKSVTGHEQIGNFGCPRNIRLQLANLLIEIYE